jgi:3-deoxy-manno-octulosonate cytidylyltransferase (CMP-KDO synthetase)
MQYLGIIPARYASTRFPGKPLADMNGKPMIQRVYEQVVDSVDAICVATDDERIRKAVEAFGGNVVMTSPNHQSGTDRCCEAMTLFKGRFDVVINIQGDEPFIHPSQIQAIKSCFQDPNTQIATLVKPFRASDGQEALFNPNSPKVVLDPAGFALFFSRSVIPYCRGKNANEWLDHHTYYKHIGIYAYRSEVLEAINRLAPSVLEKTESLEQLRWLENGYRIKTEITETETIGIDTPEDLKQAIKLLKV